MTITREEHKALRKEVVRLSWPSALQFFLQGTLMFLVDTAMVGWYIAPGETVPSGLAAMAICGPLGWITLSLLGSCAVGTGAVVARAIGSGDRQRAHQAAASGLWFGIATSGLFAVVCIPLDGWMIHAFAFGSSGPCVLAVAEAYLYWLLLTLPIGCSVMVLSTAARSAGDSMLPMVVGVVSNVFNILGNWVLIYGNWGFPEMGVEGAAIATGIARGVEALLLVGILSNGWSRLKMRFADWIGPSRELTMSIIRVSRATYLEVLIFHSAMIVYQKALLNLDDFSKAAHRIAITLESAAFMPAWGMSLAIGAITGQKLGEKRPDLAERGVQICMRMAIWLFLGVTLIYLIFPEQLCSLFTRGQNRSGLLLSVAVPTMIIGAIEIPLIAAGMILSGALKGAGDTRSPMIAAGVCGWVVRVPLSFWLGHPDMYGLPGIWMAAMGDWALRCLILWWQFRKARWKRIEI